MKISKLCDTCKKKCKIYSDVNTQIICGKYEKVINEQLTFKFNIKERA